MSFYSKLLHHIFFITSSLLYYVYLFNTSALCLFIPSCCAVSTNSTLLHYVYPFCAYALCLYIAAAICLLRSWYDPQRKHPLCKVFRDYITCCMCMRGSRKFCQRGSNFFPFFLISGKRIQLALKAGHLNGVLIAGPTLNAGSAAL